MHTGENILDDRSALKAIIWGKDKKIMCQSWQLGLCSSRIDSNYALCAKVTYIRQLMVVRSSQLGAKIVRTCQNYYHNSCF